MEAAKNAQQSDDWMLWTLRPCCRKWLNANQARARGCQLKLAERPLPLRARKYREMRGGLSQSVEVVTNSGCGEDLWFISIK